MEMFDRLARRAEAIAERRRLRILAAWKDISAVTISRADDRLVMSGPRLVRRWLGDVRLRFARWSDR